MNPRSIDVIAATNAAQRVVAAGRGYVRRVVLTGSRARGDAHPGSDLDLAVVVEGAPTWGPNEVAAERRQLQQVIGGVADLMVTTTDLYAAGHRIFGGVEWLIDNEGVEVFSTPPRRLPIARRTRDQVRRGYVATWISHALRALKATTLTSDPAPAEACIQRALAAIYVLHGAPITKREGISGMVQRLADVDPEFAGTAIPLAIRPPSVNSASALLGAVLDRLTLTEPGMVPYLAPIAAELAVTVRNSISSPGLRGNKTNVTLLPDRYNPSRGK